MKNISKKINKPVVLDIIKWIGSISLLILAGVINYAYFVDAFFVRKMVVFFVFSIAMCIVLTTVLGRLFTVFIKEAYLELQKVVWPTHQDTLYTTLIIIVVTVIISLILWGLDTVLVHIISFGLRL